MSTPFPYLADVAAKYGNNDLQIKSRKQKFIDGLRDRDLEVLAAAYREVEHRGEVHALSRYVLQGRSTGARRPLFLLMLLFKGLADRGVRPFASRSVRLFEEADVLDWTKLPSDLRYLSDPAVRYGEYQFPQEIEDFNRAMTLEQEMELQSIAIRLTVDRERIDRFLDEFRMTENREATLIYFLRNLVESLKDVGWKYLPAR